MDFKTVNSYFISYPEKSNGYRFYYPTHNMRIVESKNFRFMENGETSGSEQPWNVFVEKVRGEISLLVTSKVFSTIVVQSNNVQE